MVQPSKPRSRRAIVDAPLTLKPAKKKEHKHKGLLSAIGGTLVNAFAPGSGGVIGAAAGDLLGNLFGWGDYAGTAPITYEVNSNSSMGFQTPLAAQIPAMHTENGVTRIRKREYITDINMSEIWEKRIFALNPADPKTFPWLSKVAANYEQYKFLGVAFGFRSLTANALGATGSPAMGSVTILTQYDAYDIAPDDKVEANNAMFATSCKPSENMLHPVECDPEQTPSQPLYTGVNESLETKTDFSTARDYRLTYMGFTTVGTQGGPPAPVALGYKCGELWVTYDVMLYKPMLPLPQAAPGVKRRSVYDQLRVDVELLDLESSDYAHVTRGTPAATPRR